MPLVSSAKLVTVAVAGTVNLEREDAGDGLWRDAVRLAEDVDGLAALVTPTNLFGLFGRDAVLRVRHADLRDCEVH